VEQTCTSTSLRTGSRCEKPDGHEDWHWCLGSNGTEVWGINLGQSAKTSA